MYNEFARLKYTLTPHLRSTKMDEITSLQYEMQDILNALLHFKNEVEKCKRSGDENLAAMFQKSVWKYEGQFIGVFERLKRAYAA